MNYEKCGKPMALWIGVEGRDYRCTPCNLTPEDKAYLESIKSESKMILSPMYKRLGVDMETEELHWTNGEMFVINKKTKERREIR
jgi:hypothetical protein